MTTGVQPATGSVVANRQGWAVQLVYRENGVPQQFPRELRAVLHELMTYTRRDFLFGMDRIQPDGSRRAVNISQQALYTVDAGGALLTTAGMLPALAGAIHAEGVPLFVADFSPPPTRPDAYTPDWEHLAARMRTMQWTYRPRQEECLQAITKPGIYCGVINAPPAFGKTTLLGMLCALYRTARIAVVTRRKDVVGTIYDKLSEVIVDVGRWDGQKKRDGRVVVSTVGSMTRLPDDFDFVFVDEAHEIVSDASVAEFVCGFTQARRFGFTATPDGRADGTSARMAYAFGPQLFYMSWQEATQLGLIVPVEVRWLRLETGGDPTAGVSSPVARKKHGFWRNHRRNAVIAAAARQHEDDQVLILVETVEHALALRRQLPDYTVVFDTKFDEKERADYIAAGLLNHDDVQMTLARRIQLRHQFERAELRHVIATDVWSTGVSFEQLGVLIRADGRKSEIKDDQGPGRVVRRHDASGKAMGIIYDCWDAWSPWAEDNSRVRDKRYVDKGWTRVNVAPETLG
jgi:superfamily II DNA or RNA helicase